MQYILLKIRYFERRLSKSLKKLILFFLSNPVPFNGQSYQKQKGSGTSHRSFFRLRDKRQSLYWLHIVWRFVFELFEKLHLQIYASQFMTSWIIPLPFALLDLESLERGKITKIWISQEWKELFRWNKRHFP